MPTYQSYTDNELLSLLNAGDYTAYNEIYHRYSGLLYMYAYKRLRDRDESKDIVQDLFTVVWEKRSEFKLNSFLSGYLYTSIRNRVIKVIAHKNVESKYFSSLNTFIEDSASADHLVRKNELTAIIEEEINSLPEKMRTVFKLSRESYLSHKEIAEELDLSEATVKKQVNNALKVLRVKLGSFLFLMLLFYY